METFKNWTTIKELNEKFAEYVKTHTSWEVFQLLKETDILPYIECLNGVTKVDGFILCDVQELGNHLMEFGKFNIIKTKGSFDSDFGADPSLEVTLYGLNFGDEFFKALDKVK